MIPERHPGRWRWTGAERPPFAEPPGEGQESVWDYPRPPRVTRDQRRVVVVAGRTVIADSVRTLRVLETANPPTFYIPPDDVRMELLRPARGESTCEWKGKAEYWTVRTPEGDVAQAAAWIYPRPHSAYETIRGYVAFYPSRVDCYVNEE
ncbi:MAG TPA: DUF427 domain-containing protein, partial [Longimicrobiales bacterium]|nr:DUF427 domain-containing protein [Longimicrobiales bacterium]